MHGSTNARNDFDFTPSDINHDEAEALDGQAARCRRLAAAICDRETSEMLWRMAENYERSAAAVRRQF